jgi:hypothetical protein
MADPQKARPRAGHWPKACGRCGARYVETAWAGLPSCGVLGEADVQTIVQVWPEGARIDLRRCHCGHVLARVAA